MLMLECNTCHAKTFVNSGYFPDRDLKCDCCPVDHDHGKAAGETGQPCRPLTIHVLPGSASLNVS